MNERPRIIAFEGVDGAGKSTVINRVAEYLRARGQRVYLPRSGKEHDSRPTRMIRRLTRDPRNVVLSPRAELALYCAREAQVLTELVKPALARGETVLLDRSLLTPVVLGCFGRGLPRDECEAVARVSSGGLEPDLTLVFDVHPRTSRLRKRIEKVRTHAFRNKGRKGLAGSALKERVREGYGVLAAERGYPLFHVERITPDQLVERVIKVLEGGPVEENDGDEVPRWMVDPSWSLEEAVDSLPVPAALYLTHGLVAMRSLRARSIDAEPQLVAWGLDAEDPLRADAAARDALYALSGLSGRGLQPDDLRVQMARSEPAAVLRGLKGVVSEPADALRSQLADRAPGSVVESLAGRDDAFARELREGYWEDADAYERAASLARCTSDAAWRLRTKLLETHGFIAVESLVGAQPERADPWIERYAPYAPRAVLRGLVGRSDGFAHRMRRELMATGREVADSLRGLDDEESWGLREDLVERWASTVAHSLQGVPDGERRRAMLEQCKEAGKGDVHLLRRLVGLEEYDEAPAWARAGASLRGER